MLISMIIAYGWFTKCLIVAVWDAKCPFWTYSQDIQTIPMVDFPEELRAMHIYIICARNNEYLIFQSHLCLTLAVVRHGYGLSSMHHTRACIHKHMRVSITQTNIICNLLVLAFSIFAKQTKQMSIVHK